MRNYTIRKIRIKKLKSSNYSLVPSPPTKNKIYSDLVENSQKATLNFHFNPRFLVKPSKFQIYFAKDCKFIRLIKIYFSLKRTLILKSPGMQRPSFRSNASNSATICSKKLVCFGGLYHAQYYMPMPKYNAYCNLFCFWKQQINEDISYIVRKTSF